MSNKFDPIDPGEQLRPEYEPIEIKPGRPPDSKPIELKPDPPQKFDDDAPEVEEPELKFQGNDGEKPPTVRTMNGYEWSNGPDEPKWQMFNGKWTFSLQSVDEVSCYESFRNQVSKYADNKKWGIWVSQEGYKKYALALKIDNSSLSWRECCQAAWGFIKTHQANHFLVDRAVATLEAAMEVNGRGSQHLWSKFRTRNQASFSALEESIACAYSLRNAKTSHAKHFKTLLEHQPSGYKCCSQDGKKIESNPELSHQQAVSRLLSLFLNPVTRDRALGLHGLMLYEDHIKGTDGDLYFSIDGHKSVLEIYKAY